MECTSCWRGAVAAVGRAGGGCGGSSEGPSGRGGPRDCRRGGRAAGAATAGRMHGDRQRAAGRTNASGSVWEGGGGRGAAVGSELWCKEQITVGAEGGGGAAGAGSGVGPQRPEAWCRSATEQQLGRRGGAHATAARGRRDTEWKLHEEAGLGHKQAAWPAWPLAWLRSHDEIRNESFLAVDS